MKTGQLATVISLLSLLVFAHASAMTKSDALALSKARINGLVPGFADLAYNCFTLSEECGITDNSQNATLKWFIFEFQKAPAKVSFSSDPSQFLIDGAARVAKTGLAWDTLIIFNENLLVHEMAPGEFSALSFYEVLGVLIHEFGHHQTQNLIDMSMRTLQHEELDEIAAKVVNYLSDRTRTVDLNNFGKLYFIDLEWDNGIRNIWSHIYLDSKTELNEISAPLLRGLSCPKIYRSGHIIFSGTPMYASFRKVHAPVITQVADGLVVDQKADDASVMCADDQMGRYDVFNGYTNGVLHLALKKDGAGQLHLSSDVFFKAKSPADQTEGF